MPLYKRFVQLGRVVVLNRGQYQGKTAVIINVLDQNRVQIDGPTSGVPRHSVPMKWIYLTDIVVEGTDVGQRKKHLKKQLETQDILNKWGKTKWAQSIALSDKIAKTTDFDRFKIAKARKTRSQLIRNKLASLRNAHNKKVVGEKKFNLVLPTGEWK